MPKYGPFYPRVDELHPRERQKYEQLGWHCIGNRVEPPHVPQDKLPRICDPIKLAQELGIPKRHIEHACRCYGYSSLYGIMYHPSILDAKSYASAHGRYDRRSDRVKSLSDALRMADPRKQWYGTARQAREDFWISEDMSKTDIHAALRGHYGPGIPTTRELVYNKHRQCKMELQLKQLP